MAIDSLVKVHMVELSSIEVYKFLIYWHHIVASVISVCMHSGIVLSISQLRAHYMWVSRDLSRFNIIYLETVIEDVCL